MKGFSQEVVNDRAILNKMTRKQSREEHTGVLQLYCSTLEQGGHQWLSVHPWTQQHCPHLAPHRCWFSVMHLLNMDAGGVTKTKGCKTR